MRNNRPLISVLLLAMFINLIPCVNVFAAENTFVSEKTELLSGIGIYDTNYEDTATVSRAAFAIMLTKLVNAAEVNENYSKGAFFDISSSYYAAGAIDYVYNMGYMDAADDAFRPDDNITGTEATNAILKVIGYSEIIKEHGPEAAARGSGIKTFLSDSEITVKQLTPMLYDALYAPMMVKTSPTDYAKDSGQTIMSKYLKLLKGEGVVNKIDGLNLNGTAEEMKDDRVEISGNSYVDTNGDAEEFFGMQTEFWYRDDSDEIVYIRSGRDYKKIEVNYRDLSYSYGTLGYEKNHKTKWIKMDSNAAVILNGMPAYAVTDANIAKTGTAKFVMNGNKCVAAIFFEYDNYVVDMAKNQEVRFKYDKGSMSFDSGVFFIKKNGNETDYGDIKENDVLSVAHNRNGNVWYIESSDNFVEGKIISTDIEEGIVRFDHEECYIDKSFMTLAATKKYDLRKIAAGIEASFGVNFLGEICSMNIMGGEFQYGYIKKVWQDEEDESIYIKMLTKRHNGFHTYQFGKKVLINGESKKRENVYSIVKDYYDSCNSENPPVVKFKQNYAGEIKQIVTKVIDGGYAYDDDSINKPIPRKPGQGYLLYYNYGYWAGVADFGSSIRTHRHNPDAVITFRVPSDGNEKDFAVGTPNDFGMDRDQGWWDNIFYDIDEFAQPKLIVYYPDSVSDHVDEFSKYVIGVQKVLLTLNDEDEQIMRVCGYENGDYVEYETKPDVELITFLETVKKGDFIQIEKDTSNVITQAAFYITYNLSDFDFTRLDPTGDIGSRLKDAEAKFAVVDEVRDPFVKIQGDIKQDWCVIMMAQDFNKNGEKSFTIYDGDEFYSGTINDLRKGDLVFWFLEKAYGHFRSIVVFRNNPYRP